MLPPTQGCHPPSYNRGRRDMSGSAGDGDVRGGDTLHSSYVTSEEQDSNREMAALARTEQLIQEGNENFKVGPTLIVQLYGAEEDAHLVMGGCPNLWLQSRPCVALPLLCCIVLELSPSQSGRGFEPAAVAPLFTSDLGRCDSTPLCPTSQRGVTPVMRSFHPGLTLANPQTDLRRAAEIYQDGLEALGNLEDYKVG